ISKDDYTWDLQNEILVDFYGQKVIQKPNKFHQKKAELKKQVALFAKFNCDILAELPILLGSESVKNQGNGDSPSRERRHFQPEQFDMQILHEEVNVLIAEVKCLVHDAHNICRDKASEILLFMLSDSDRMKLVHDETYTHPIAYAMKGYSLKVSTIRDMIEKLRNILHENNIPILCECFDGQWANLAFKDVAGNPLTILHLNNKSWEAACKLSRRGVLLKLRNLSTIKTEDLVCVCQDLTYSKLFSTWGNVSVSVGKNQNGKICYYVESNGGDIDGRMLLSHASLHKVKKLKQNEINCFITESFESKPTTGIQPDDLDIISTLQPDLVKEIYEDYESAELNGPIGLENFLASPKLQIITDILSNLHERGKDPNWQNCTEDDLFPNILMNKEILMSFTKYDLGLIRSIIEKYTVRKIFATKDNKDAIAAKIAFLFGSGELVYRMEKKVPALKNIAHNVVEAFPLIILQSVYAGIVHVKNKREWKSKLNLDMKAFIPVLNDYVPLFYHPEFSYERNQFEIRTMDYTHQLTNLRAIVCRNGVENVRDTEFKRICDDFPKVLSKGIVYGSLDKQCASFAIQLFSEPVEEKLIQNKAYNEALFTKLVRNWYNACDSRGMAADERVNNLWAFYAYLTKDVEFDKFPGFSQYVKGIPIITYAGILQNISVRLSLYKVSKFGTYNHRSISSLVCESFFSTMASKDPGKTGCPKAVDVPKIMSDMITIEEYKQDSLRLFSTNICFSERLIWCPYIYNSRKRHLQQKPNAALTAKCHNSNSTIPQNIQTKLMTFSKLMYNYNLFRDFHMVTANRPLYQPNIPENFAEGSTVDENTPGHYINHLFDVSGITKSKKRKRRTEISHGLAPLKGVKPVRDKGKFRIDESCVMPNLLQPVPETDITHFL
ncbi:MAG: hypothetical protein MJE68_23910, partial [Proteobacteria bacterium]|nr:hypothetical protein [Pseudomonadota bacterium]